LGVPVALGTSIHARRKGPDRAYASAGLVLALVEALILVGIVLFRLL